VKWPHPTSVPKPWIYLASWLEATGEKGKARQIYERTRDPRYGLANWQGVVNNALERL
jgi:hypothetical protein